MDDWRVDPEDWPEAIRKVEGPQLVVAGPGTGKTEFLVRRVVELVERHGVELDRVAVLTFSRRAAADLRRRVASSLTRSYGAIGASTFHSLAFRLLERHGYSRFGWKTMPSLLTGPEQVAIVAELLADENPAAWPLLYRPLLTTNTFADEVADFIMRAGERLLSPDDIEQLASRRDDWRALPAFIRRYSNEIHRRNRLDYGSLQSLAVDLLAESTIVSELSQQFPFVLVDEYQDTTAAQSELLDRITSQHRNITVAADPYQSIYSFRGAELHNVVEFPDRFRAIDGSPARRIILTTSFRVPGEILERAVRLTSGGELPGGAGAVRPAPHSGRVEVLRFQQQSEEAEWIAAEVERLHLEEQLPLQRMAVLVRSKRRFLPELSRALERRGINHDLPDARLVDHSAIRQVFDLVRSAANGDQGPAELDRAIKRLLLGPLLALPLHVERACHRLRLHTGLPWPDVIRETVPNGRGLADLLTENSWATEMSAADGFWHLWESLPQFTEIVGDPGRREFRNAWAAFAQVLNRQQERDTKLTLAGYVDLSDREDFEATPLLGHTVPRDDRLTLTTLHQSKGLSFDVVFIADAVEGVMPDLRRQRSILETRYLSPYHDPETERRFRLQEEMRLAYTAMTRASRRVIWTATDAGNEDPQRRPSRFLNALGLEPTEPGRRRDDVVPVTAAEAESALRRKTTDAEVPASDRLAAAFTLVRRPNRALRSVDQFAHTRHPGSDRGLLGPDLRLSPSQAESYATCPRRYAITRRLGAGGESGPYALFGELIHEILERAESTAVEQGETHASPEIALKALDDLFPAYDFAAHGSADAWKQRAEKLLTDMYEAWIRPGAVPVLLEHEVEAEIGGVRWRGRIDRIERTPSGGLRIVDYKTTKSPVGTEEAAGSIQLGFYLHAATRDDDVLERGVPEEAEFWYPLTDRKQQWFAFDPGRLPDVVAGLGAIGEAIAAEDWSPVVGPHCQRCDVRITCPEWPEGSESFVR